MNIVTPKFGVGASALRKEDDALVRGQGRYTDDFNKQDQLYGYVVRSPYAAADFTIASVEEALASDGVHLVMTAADVADLGDIRCHVKVKQPDGTKNETRETPLLCKDRVRFVGDAIAFVVADSIRQAQDAAELIEIDWEDGEAVTDMEAALSEGSPLLWPELGTNRVYAFEQGDKAETDAAFKDAAHIIEVDYTNNRLVANYMEPRGALAEWDSQEESFTLTTGSQGVHHIRNTLARDIFSMETEKIRVISGDVGGGFGTRIHNYREYPLTMEAARRLGRPVKWLSDRSEHFVADAHGRDNLVKAQMAVDEDGRFQALRIDVKANMGAYLNGFGPMVPQFGAMMATGVYDIRIHHLRIEGVYTNTTPVDAYRGAGRPEAALLIERLVDACARQTGIDISDLRRRNFIQPEQFPYVTASGRNYDVGDYEKHLDQALERADAAGFEARADEAKARRKIRGFGTAVYIEACAFAGSEPAHLHLNGDGTLTLHIGTQSNGQGHVTAYSQFIADRIGIDFDKIIVKQGDTNDLDSGGGTGGSRSIPIGGVSVDRAGEMLATQMRKIASDRLEASVDDIELVDGAAKVVGTDQSISYKEIAAAAEDPDQLKAMADIKQDEATYPNGTHICEVEIDPETGKCEVIAYTIVDDFGMVVNPTLLMGQVHGGAVQGIGQCLLEGVIYGEDGQLLTASLMDYTMPRADDMPSFDFTTYNIPSTTNAMGMKGAGEAGTIGACPAALNAVIDALDRAYGIRHIEMPTTPQRIWQTIQQAADA
ncbi:xanthine dehydrogenase family protein molybdopterin-binding subunit [Hoeflea prorocentri]|uniref:Xanthine dehydrogenase family protein molybdopterin-binding subunit n=1 Tax=Hoeflea prorocentri TaxID=1922333 RepID=A0A9X3ZI03_9HYPH|nr:xanthine dehydrogenase family protein molybdopterin-binding subunit [Hoeflea prorocentri]MCY6381493.1 xanthine dehydrogenase family protein molybdopterin-binding subunit [Hoeflea prorocentri]MDA5399293.1 xanthine dehydrogenase family protein molybdopterin-binding subunit [Hoeflea prorocentri]